MSFALPEKQYTDSRITSEQLRALEQDAPKPTAKEIREALLAAAKELDDWKAVAEDCVKQLEEAQALRVGQMDSHSRMDEIARQIKRAMSDTAVRLRAKL